MRDNLFSPHLFIEITHQVTSHLQIFNSMVNSQSWFYFSAMFDLLFDPVFLDTCFLLDFQPYCFSLISCSFLLEVLHSFSSYHRPANSRGPQISFFELILFSVYTYSLRDLTRSHDSNMTVMLSIAKFIGPRNIFPPSVVYLAFSFWCLVDITN